MLISPKAVPMRCFSTSIAVDGQITAGINEKLTPIIVVDTHRLACVAPKTMNVSGKSAAAIMSNVARRPNRSAANPHSGVAMIAAKNTQLFVKPACPSVRPLTS